MACLDEIPTFIINMRPAGLRLFGEQNEIISFDDESIHQSWEEYDATLEALIKVNATLRSAGTHPSPDSKTMFSFSSGLSHLAGDYDVSASK